MNYSQIALTLSLVFTTSLGEASKNNLRGLIVGGNDADPGEYPTFAGNGDGSCGATLIHSDILLTAAHCGGFTGVYIGSSSLDGGGQPRVATVYERPHPDYTDSGDSHDIMLVRLETPQTSPLQALATDNSVPPDGATVTVIGFGALQTGGETAPDTLQEVNVFVRNFEECRDAYTDHTIVDLHHICAADPNGGRDSCQGDSGGPLFYNGVQVGISSFDNGSCGSPDGGVYTRVSNYKDWIEATICAISCDPPASCGEGAGADCGLTGSFNPTPGDDDQVDDDNYDDDGR